MTACVTINCIKADCMALFSFLAAKMLDGAVQKIAHSILIRMKVDIIINNAFYAF